MGEIVMKAWILTAILHNSPTATPEQVQGLYATESACKRQLQLIEKRVEKSSRGQLVLECYPSPVWKEATG